MKYYIIQTPVYMPWLLANIAPHVLLLKLPQRSPPPPPFPFTVVVRSFRDVTGRLIDVVAFQLAK